MKHEALAILEAQVASDLERIAHPSADWLRPRMGPDGKPALDVLIVGAGQSGLAIAFGLMRSRVTNILVLDKASAGREGPWRTYARMHTLRSPKEFTGPDLDVPSLTYQSWHEAKYGEESWRSLALVPKEDWANYLDWFRRVTSIPVRNETVVVDIRPDGELLAATVRHGAAEEKLFARKIVLATGQESLGDWIMPDVIAALPAPLRAHTAEPVDFATLKGKRVAVIGAGASAFDNAAVALEAGAAEVHLLCRRAEIQVVQPYRWLTFRGFLRHLSDLDDAWRWRFMRAILAMREGFPQATYDRCAVHENFHLHLGSPIVAASAQADGVHLTTPDLTLVTDFVIAAVGIDTDLPLRPELRGFAHNVAAWNDRYAPTAEERDERLGRFPYLADDYAFMEREGGVTPWIKDIHLFSIAATMSFGPSGSSINALTTAVPKLVNGITRGLFKYDIDRHWASFRAYDVPQAILTERSKKS